MKKRLVLLTLLLLLLSLCACGAEPAPAASTEPAASTAAPTEPAPAPVSAGPVVLRGLHIRQNEDFGGLCAWEGKAAVLLLHWDREADQLRHRVLLIDPAAAAVTDSVELEPLDGWIDLTRFTANCTGFYLIDENGERCAAYDRDGRFQAWIDWPTMSQENVGWRNRLLSDGCFWKGAEYAQFSDLDGGALSHVVAFYDETDRVHALGMAYDSIAAQAGHRLLLQQSMEGGEGLEYSLLDVDAGRVYGSVRFQCGVDRPAVWVNACGAAMTEDWALLALEWSTGHTWSKELCLWRPDPAESSPADVKTLTEELLTSQILSLRAGLEAQGMTLHLDEAPDAELTPTIGLSDDVNYCQTGASLFGEYRILRQLADFTAKLPAGFIRELYTGVPGTGEDPLGLDVYLVRDIPGSAAAFANAWRVPMMVCFATEEYSASHLAHEFMHLIDLRLDLTLDRQGKDMEAQWGKLSPSWAYDGGLSWEEDLALEPYFVSAYARTNHTEDRAETFERLFDSETPVEEQWWYRDKPGVQDKVRWLIGTIRECFPSAAASETLFWEKLKEP